MKKENIDKIAEQLRRLGFTTASAPSVNNRSGRKPPKPSAKKRGEVKWRHGGRRT